MSIMYVSVPFSESAAPRIYLKNELQAVSINVLGFSLNVLISYF